ncbi:hypothetical protein RRG08_043611 [Elysia crispata]|uniref:Uncharacterized protein n=1 Tax=Elysia crispata TaxID=231223 RepID=A0AAE1A5I5_9GAST|nr:hypothetical protein RRG08_043611 [Elysia crispata]
MNQSADIMTLQAVIDLHELCHDDEFHASSPPARRQPSCLTRTRSLDILNFSHIYGISQVLTRELDPESRPRLQSHLRKVDKPLRQPQGLVDTRAHGSTCRPQSDSDPDRAGWPRRSRGDKFSLERELIYI